MLNFSGLNIGQKQEVGIMSVYPLIGDDIDFDMASIFDLKFSGTSNYGSMVFTNLSDKPIIVPTGYSIITKQEAQDHGLPFATFIEGGKEKTVHNACCIQQTQCGYISDDEKNEFMTLPLYIRKNHFKKEFKEKNGELIWSGNNDFSRLWDIISTFQKKLVTGEGGHLVYFFNKFMDKLTQFNAEFEVVERQRGAIIMINGEIVGIEVAPTHHYWKTVWNSLVRDCYGSEILRRTYCNLIGEFNTSISKELDLSECLTIEEIEFKINSHSLNEIEKMSTELFNFSKKEKIYILKETSLIKSNSSKEVNYNIFKTKNEDSFGEVFSTSTTNEMIYCSILF